MFEDHKCNRSTEGIKVGQDQIYNPGKMRTKGKKMLKRKSGKKTDRCGCRCLRCLVVSGKDRTTTILVDF